MPTDSPNLPGWLTGRRPAGPPPRPPITGEEVTATALRLVDQHGLADFSMRKLAEELGTGTSSLYWRFSSKEELLLSVADAVLSEVPVPPTGDTDWKSRLRAYASSFRDAVHAHPNAAPLLINFITVSPGVLRAVEGVVEVLETAGLTGDGLRDAYNAYAGYVLGFTIVEMAPPFSEEWTEAIPEYLRSLASSEFPVITKFLPHLENQAFGLRWKTWAEASLEKSFSFGLEALFVGFEHQIGRAGERDEGLEPSIVASSNPSA